MYESVSRANLAQSGCSKLGSAWRRALSGVLVAVALTTLKESFDRIENAIEIIMLID